MTLEHRLIRDRTAPGKARRLVRSWLGDHARVGDAALAVSELVTNAVQHADLEDDQGITVRFRSLGEAFRVEVWPPTAGTVEAPEGVPNDGLRGGVPVVGEAGAGRSGARDGLCDSAAVVWFELE